MTSKRHSNVLLAVSCLTLVACASEFTNISPSPPSSYTRLGKATGSACGSLGLVATAYYAVPMGINSRVD